MDKHEEAILRADEAQRVLNSPLFEAAFADTRAALLEALAGLDSMTDKRAAELHNMVRCLDKVRRCLQVHIDTGKAANAEIEGRKRGILGAMPFARRA